MTPPAHSDGERDRFCPAVRSLAAILRTASVRRGHTLNAPRIAWIEASAIARSRGAASVGIPHGQAVSTDTVGDRTAAGTEATGIVEAAGGLTGSMDAVGDRGAAGAENTAIVGAVGGAGGLIEAVGRLAFKSACCEVVTFGATCFVTGSCWTALVCPLNSLHRLAVVVPKWSATLARSRLAFASSQKPS
jgi:hypothetical protein